MKKLEISASFLCLCVVIILTSLAFFYQKGNTTDGTVGSDSPDKENTLKPDDETFFPSRHTITIRSVHFNLCSRRAIVNHQAAGYTLLGLRFTVTL